MQKIIGVNEYVENSLLVTCSDNPLIYVFKNLGKEEVVQIQTKIDQKYWVEKMPGFDEVNYPFILCAGRNEIWIANINTKVVKNLINASSTPVLT